MPIETVPGTKLQYYLTVFDEKGHERPEDGALLSARAIERMRDGDVTDVFFVSHGWKGDVPAAREQYNKWIGATAAVPADVDRVKAQHSGFRSLIIGLHWPSLPWGDEEIGGGVSFGGPSLPMAVLVDRYAGRIADTEAARQALQTIFDAARTQISPQKLPDEVRTAYQVLDKEAGMGSAGEGAAPGDDREPFDPDRAYAFGRQGATFGAVGLGGILSPLRQLSFWKMKDRARVFGEGGAHQVLSALQQAAVGQVRVHGMGHSFGCIVTAAMIAGPPGAAPLRTPIDSVFLAQGALSLWSFCESIEKADGRTGYFNSIVKRQQVQGPIVTTQSKRDTAVGVFYPLAAGAARQASFAPGDLPKYGGVGAFGAQGPGLAIEGLKMRGIDERYEFQPHVVYNLESSQVISEGGGASGAHSDIAKPEVAHAFWGAVAHAGTGAPV